MRGASFGSPVSLLVSGVVRKGEGMGPLTFHPGSLVK